MRAIRRILSAVVGWLDRKFPDQLTASEVEQRIGGIEKRIAALEHFVPQARVEIAKVKMLVGIEQLTSVD